MLVAHGHAVLENHLTKLRQTIAPLLVVDFGKPAKVIESKIHGVDIAPAGKSEHLRVREQDSRGHIADVKDMVVAKLATRGLGDNCGGVGIVEDPGVWTVFLGVAYEVEDAGDGPDAIGDRTAGAAGFLSHATVLERDALVLATHLKAALADLREDEVDIGECLFGIGRHDNFDVRSFLLDELLHDVVDEMHALFVDVVQGEFAQR